MEKSYIIQLLTSFFGKNDMRIGSSYASSMLYGAYGQQGQRADQARRVEEENSLPTAAAKKVAEKMKIRETGASTDVAAQEQKVLAREQALKASAVGGSVSTTYTYSTSPDGQRYISGAEVTITAPQEVLDAIPGGTPSASQPGQEKSENTADTAGTAEADEAAKAAAMPGETKEKDATGKTDGAAAEDDPAMSAEITRLKQTERDVIAHEAAHKAVGGQYAGGVSYTYTTGPDGKRYISGGEVSISTPATNDPEKALRMAEQVRRAALAPANPSSQDISVAASATQAIATARADISKAAREELAEGQGAEKTGTDTGKTGAAEATGAANGSNTTGATSDSRNTAGQNQKTGIADLSHIDLSRSKKAADAYASLSGIHENAKNSGRIYAIG